MFALRLHAFIVTEMELARLMRGGHDVGRILEAE